ncbi:MAG: hypothetical protein ACT4P1_03080 [Sporichthyaceae bacterium]
MSPLALPAAIAGVLAGLERLLALPWLPVAWVYRRRRGMWPAERFDEDGRWVERTYHPSWREARLAVHRMRLAASVEEVEP